MAEWWETLNDIGGLVPSMEGRLVVTVLALGAALGAYLASKAVKEHFDEAEYVHPALTEFLATSLYVGTFFVAVAVVAGVWEQADLIDSIVTSEVLGKNALPKLAATALVLVLAQTVTNFAGRLFDRLQESSRGISEHQREIFYRTSQVLLYVSAFFVVLGFWNVDPTGLLVGAGFLGIVVGMAARQTLGAVLAGFVLMFSRPFEIGDWVEIDEAEGVVKDITIVNTRVETFDGESVVLPNDNVSATNVVNKSRKGRLRIEVEVGVDYDADVGRAREVATEAVSDLEETLRVPSPQVVVKRFADSSVVLGVRFWIDNPSARRKWRARTAVVGAVKEAFETEGIDIPFPQRALSRRDAPADGAVPARAMGAVAGDGDAGEDSDAEESGNASGSGSGSGTAQAAEPDGGDE